MKFRVDIAFFRVAVIAFLVVFHAFCPYADHWNYWGGDLGFDIPAYWWLDNWSYSFFLQGFVFISGYIFGIQKEQKKQKDVFSIKGELKKKFIRLMVPSLLFSTLYMALFNQWQGWLTPYRIINGWQHFWFLPMLFSCFVVTMLLDRLKIKSLWILLTSFILMLIPLPGLPMRLDMVAKYFIFFYTGVIGGGIFTCKLPKWSIPVLAIIQVVLFVILFGFEKQNGQLMTKLFFIPRLFEFIYSSLGILVIFALASYISDRLKSNRSIRIMKVANDYSFGVYIFQQFILFFLYYRTTLSYNINPYVLPWLFLIITFAMSIFFTFLSKKIPYLNKIL